NPRSTVGTATEINDYLRLLYARVGTPYCPNHDIPLERQSPEQMVDRILELPDRTRIQILSPAVRDKRGQHKKLLERISKDGYIRVRVDGEIYDVSEVPELEKNKKHTIEVVVDRIAIKDGVRSRLFDSVEQALLFSEGYMVIDVIGEEEMYFNEHFACPFCDFSIDELEPILFSFNSPFGACPTCDGLGTKLEVDLDLVVPDKNLSLNEHAIEAWKPISSQYYLQLLKTVCKNYNIDMDKSFKKLTKREFNKIFYGSGDEKIHFHYVNDFGREHKNDIKFEGVMNNIKRRYHETSSDFIRETLEEY